MSFPRHDTKTRARRMLRQLAVGCITAAVVVGTALLVHAGTAFTVDGTVYGFQDTGVDLDVGKYVWIESTGEIRYASTATRTTDPNGFGSDQNGTVSGSGIAPSAIRLSLVGRLGSTQLMPAGVSPHTATPGEGFIGGRYVRVMTESDRLYLGYNDSGAGDNAGSFSVDISPTFTVQGNVAGFQDTGVDVNEGDVMWIESTGEINYAVRATARTDPDGFGLEKNGTGSGTGITPSAISLSLVGRVGSSALLPEGTSPYSNSPGEGFVGSSYCGVMPEDGRLHLGYNDGGATDNSGAFDVEISPYFVVDGTIEGTWLDTGLDLEPGDVLEIDASGQIVYSGSGAWTDPDGFSPYKDGTGYSGLVPGAIFGSLVGRIGDTLLAPEGDSPYIGSPGDGFIGSDYRQTITNAGRLYLAYNDGGADDNGGYFLVSVNVGVPEPSSVVLLALGLVGLIVCRRRRKQ